MRSPVWRDDIVSFLPFIATFCVGIVRDAFLPSFPPARAQLVSLRLHSARSRNVSLSNPPKCSGALHGERTQYLQDFRPKIQYEIHETSPTASTFWPTPLPPQCVRRKCMHTARIQNTLCRSLFCPSIARNLIQLHSPPYQCLIYLQPESRKTTPLLSSLHVSPCSVFPVVLPSSLSLSFVSCAMRVSLLD